MKSIVVSSNCSGGGKTTIALGLMRAIMKRNYSVQGYKVGPDYIDTAFHSQITGKPSRNLDLFLMGEAGVKESFARGKGEYGVVEGVMGLYDGKGLDTAYSTAHVAKTLKLPVVLIISPKAQSVTLCAEIKGIIEYENVDFAGVILNNVSSGYFELLKRAIELNCGIKVFGYVPQHEGLELKSRHLGLIQSSEVGDLDNKIDLCAKLIEDNVDMDALMECFKETEVYEVETPIDNNKGLKIGVAYDSAFNFYYRDNLEILESLGEVVYFSPLKDKRIPENLDFLYIGGGYPEVFKKELSSNNTMRDSIKRALENNLNCYAECGGLMYLTEYIEDEPMVGFFKGRSYMTPNLNNFGYAELNVAEGDVKFPEGVKINCHEFHKSLVEVDEKKIYTLNKEGYDGTLKTWQCGYLKNNTLAGYAHVNFLGNIEFIKQLLNIENR